MSRVETNEVVPFSGTTLDVGEAGDTVNIPGTLTVETLESDLVVSTFVNFNASSGTPSINKSKNVSSITDNGVGDYTINFTNNYADAHYVVSTWVRDYGDAASQINWIALSASDDKTVSALRINCISHSGSGNADGWSLSDEDDIQVMIFGELA